MKIESHRYENIGEEYKSAVLSNGLEVRVVEKPGFLTKFAAFAVKYGGADMRFRLGGELIDTPAGIAHYLEHKMFDMPGGDNALTMMSANGADPNAFTSEDMTCYYFQCTEGFYDNLRILLNFVTTPYFTEETVDKERSIISQEIMMGLDNPYRTMYYNLLALLYRSHPIRQDVAGSVESISRITAETLYDCHRTFYIPGNMVLCVEGDVSTEEVIAVAEDVLKDWAAAPVPAADYGESDGLLPYETFCSVALPVSEKQFLIGAKVPPDSTDLLRQHIVSGLALQVIFGHSSEFYNRLYREGLINQSFSWDMDYVAGTVVFTMGGESADPERVLDEVNKTVAEVCAKGLDCVLFERIKKAAVGRNLWSFEDFDNVCISMAEGIFDGYNFFDAPAVTESVRIEECLDFIRECLAPELLAISIVIPSSPAEVSQEDKA